MLGCVYEYERNKVSAKQIEKAIKYYLYRDHREDYDIYRIFHALEQNCYPDDIIEYCAKNFDNLSIIDSDQLAESIKNNDLSMDQIKYIIKNFDEKIIHHSAIMDFIVDIFKKGLPMNQIKNLAEKMSKLYDEDYNVFDTVSDYCELTNNISLEKINSLFNLKGKISQYDCFKIHDLKKKIPIDELMDFVINNKLKALHYGYFAGLTMKQMENLNFSLDRIRNYVKSIKEYGFPNGKEAISSIKRRWYKEDGIQGFCYELSDISGSYVYDPSDIIYINCDKEEIEDAFKNKWNGNLSEEDKEEYGNVDKYVEYKCEELEETHMDFYLNYNPNDNHLYLVNGAYSEFYGDLGTEELEDFGDISNIIKEVANDNDSGTDICKKIENKYSKLDPMNKYFKTITLNQYMSKQ